MIQFLIELIEKVKVVCSSTKLTFLCSVKQILFDLMKKVEVQKRSVSIITVFIYLQITVWKFQDFFVSQILREINFGDARSSKIAV